MKMIHKVLPLSILPLMTGCHEAAQQPNVIVILADDLGYGDLSAYGATALHTPNIDRLCNEGVRFTNGYATSATSTPSRYAMMTGMYPWKNERARILAGDAPLIIDTAQFTLPEMFRDNGYCTGAIGKWHLGMGAGNLDWNSRIYPCANDIGFDYSCLIAATVDRVPTVYIENGEVAGLDPLDPIYVDYKKNFEGEPTAISNPEMLKMKWSHGHNNSIHNGIPRIGYQKGGTAARWVDEDMADYFVDKVKSFISQHRDEPFFLYYGLHQPHVPRTPHSRFVGSTTMGPRGDAIVEADWCVGELLATLEANDLLDNTIILFSSDNGPVLNDGYCDQAQEKVGDHKPAGALRGGKYSLFEGGTRVPFAVYWKGHIRPRVSEAMVSQMDILPSLAAYLNFDIPEGLDGADYADVFFNGSEHGREEYIQEAFFRLAFRSQNWSLIPPYQGDKTNESGNELANGTTYQLYDLSKDPSQQNDLAQTDTLVLNRLKARFLELAKGYYNHDTEQIILE